MGFFPAPKRIHMTDDEFAAAVAAAAAEEALHPHPGGPAAQVSPFKDNPNLFARYQLLQNGREVGWVYVAGNSTTDCAEHWQLYKSTVTGTGEAPIGQTPPPRAAYIWPSQGEGATQARDVTMRMVYFDGTSGVRAPANLQPGVHYDEIKATCS